MQDGSQVSLEGALTRQPSKKSSMGAAALAAVALMVSLVLVRPVYLVRIEDVTWGREIATAVVRPGEQIYVEYRHSMYGVMQRETFSIKRGGQQFELAEVSFGSLAAALYYDPDPQGGLASMGGRWILRPAPRSYETLTYRVSRQSGHVLGLGGRVIDLSGGAPGSGALVRISLRRQVLVTDVLTGTLSAGQRRFTSSRHAGL